MKNTAYKKHVVYTNKAKCRDCSRCVRACPVNAIKIENGQAQVIPERCIDCGTCVLECPQNAKTYNYDLDSILNWINNGEYIAASLAPSFASAYPNWKQLRIASALRSAGISYIGETAIGAYQVARHTAQYIQAHPDSSHICTACPAVNSYIEKYSTENIPQLVPVVSPMEAHARMLKRKNPKCKVIFIGPCIAKIKESKRPEVEKYVDAAITFENLEEFLNIRNISLENCEESNFDEIPGEYSRLFPLEGGLLKTAKLHNESFKNNTLTVSGPEEVKAALDLINQSNEPYLIEPLYCKHGCINGPAIPELKNNFQNRSEVINYDKNNPAIKEVELVKAQQVITRFTKDEPNTFSDFSEEEIREVLAKTGKENTEYQLNCGACGYNTCRDKAIAVLQNLAEVEMCIPWMRRLAEQKNDLLLMNDPNGVVILDDKLSVLDINPAFKKMFVCSDQIIGKPISYLIDQTPFNNLISDKENIKRQEIKYPNYNLTCHVICYYLQDTNQIVGIFVDITDFQNSSSKLKEIKSDTITKVHELLDHQVSMAQEFAKFLGENTAKGEILMQKLMDNIDKQ